MTTRSDITIWVDADACPVRIKEMLIKTALRLDLELTFVANQSIGLPKSPKIEMILVQDGADAADDLIAEQIQAFDLLITQDIPLAARVVAKQALAIGPRGEVFDDSTVHGRVASRNLMEQFRSMGQETRGPKPLSNQDVQSFANALDRSITRLRRQLHRS